MKKQLCLGLALIMAAGALTACGSKGNSGSAGNSAPAASDKVYTVKLAHQAADTHPWQWTSVKFKELVEERTDGKVQVEIHYGGTLGYDRDLIEGMQAGTVDLALVTTAPLASFVPEVGILDLPYVFSDWDHVTKFTTSEAAGKLAEKIEAVGLVNICFYPNGFRHCTNNAHPLRKIDDLKGLKMRVMQSDVFINTFNALGASATPMSWSEVPTSLQQGTIDGQENGTITNFSNNIWEYQKYMSLTGHCAYMTTFMGSKKLLEKLPSEYKDIIIQAGIEATQYGIEEIKVQEPKILEEIKGKGMEVNDDVDFEGFAAATAGVRKDFTDKYGTEIMDAIEALK